jgi:hypothetical protein
VPDVGITAIAVRAMCIFASARGRKRDSRVLVALRVSCVMQNLVVHPSVAHVHVFVASAADDTALVRELESNKDTLAHADRITRILLGRDLTFGAALAYCFRHANVRNGVCAIVTAGTFFDGSLASALSSLSAPDSHSKVRVL